MKQLLELLTKELSKWPVNTSIITQDKTGWLCLHDIHRNDSGWYGDCDMRYGQKLERAVDHRTAIITKEMWEQAK